MATRSAHPGDIFGRSLSNIVLKTAQACTADRSPVGVQMPVTQHQFFSAGESAIHHTFVSIQTLGHGLGHSACASVRRGSVGLFCWTGCVEVEPTVMCVSRGGEERKMQTHVDHVLIMCDSNE